VHTAPSLPSLLQTTGLIKLEKEAPGVVALLLQYWSPPIFSFILLITMLIGPLLIFQSHQSLTIHLLMNWNLPKLSRHFIPSSWLCQVLIALRPIPLLTKNVLNLAKLLITLLLTLKINLSYYFHILHRNHMILFLKHCRIHM